MKTYFPILYILIGSERLLWYFCSRFVISTQVSSWKGALRVAVLKVMFSHQLSFLSPPPRPHPSLYFTSYLPTWKQFNPRTVSVLQSGTLNEDTWVRFCAGSWITILNKGLYYLTIEYKSWRMPFRCNCYFIFGFVLFHCFPIQFGDNLSSQL